MSCMPLHRTEAGPARQQERRAHVCPASSCFPIEAGGGCLSPLLSREGRGET
jgi:hypothetical protein